MADEAIDVLGKGRGEEKEGGIFVVVFFNLAEGLLGEFEGSHFKGLLQKGTDGGGVGVKDEQGLFVSPKAGEAAEGTGKDVRVFIAETHDRLFGVFSFPDGFGLDEMDAVIFYNAVMQSEGGDFGDKGQEVLGVERSEEFFLVSGIDDALGVFVDEGREAAF